MSDLCRLIWCALIGLFRSRAALEAEILVLRHQLNVLQRRSRKRVILGSIDRLLLVGLYRLAPGTLDALKIIRPATLLRWHRAGFRAYWRWKSRPLGGRPPRLIEKYGRKANMVKWKEQLNGDCPKRMPTSTSAVI